MVKKNPHAMWETWVQSLGWEDPLEEGMATHSSILAWRIPETEEPGGYSLQGHKEQNMTEGTERACIPFNIGSKYVSLSHYLASKD